MIWLLVAVGGGLGSVLRYGTQRVAATYAGPDTVMGTLIVNLAGSFALGFLLTLLLGRFPVSNEIRTFLTFGFLGGFTTFSNVSYQTISLLESGFFLSAIASLAANVILGLAVAYAGVALARII